MAERKTNSASKKESAAEAPVEQKATDARVEWFSAKVIKGLGVKVDKFKKMSSAEENVKIITDFLESMSSPVLVFYINQREDVVPATSFPSVFKRKSIYFTKNDPRQVPVDKPQQMLTMGEFTASPLEQLSNLLDEVYLPLLSNPKNSANWPEVVAVDVMRHFHQLKSAVYVITGLSKGKTLLPLPHGTSDSNISDKNLLHALESAVIDWTHQIKDVIKSDSAAPLEEGLSPGPIVEIEFWAAKAANLQCIYEQLTDEKIQKISQVLEVSKSTYFPAFKNIFDEVVTALDEANDINIHLKPLRTPIEQLMDLNEFTTITQILRPTMHILMLIWNNSKHYNVPNRLTVLLQEICNEVIKLATGYIQVDELFKGDPEEQAHKLRTVLSECNAFKALYQDYKTRLADSKLPWNFDGKLIFSRLDNFIFRVHRILELFTTIIEFKRLEKVEIGGSKGKILSSQVVQISNEFNEAMSIFSKIKYNILDITSPQFDIDVSKFQTSISDMDRRISTILCQSFDDCAGLQACFRLLEAFAGLINRPIIEKNFDRKFYTLLSGIENDLDEVLRVFDLHKDNPPIHNNMPPITGTLAWVHELKDRIKKELEKMFELNGKIMETLEGKQVKVKYDNLIRSLDKYEAGIYSKWADNIIDESEHNLDKSVLSRGASGLLDVNFDPKLVALLREIKYFNSLGVEIPEKAKSIFSANDKLRRHIFNLEYIVTRYNTIKTTISSVEAPLIATNLESIDAKLTMGMESLNWKSADIESYISDTKAQVDDLGDRLNIAKNNITNIRDIMSQWYSVPLLDRKDGKKLLNLEEKESKLAAFYSKVKKDGEAIHEKVNDIRLAFKADENSDSWKAYINDVDAKVFQGLFETVKCSLQYILDNMDEEKLSKSELGPLFEAKLELGKDSLVFTPEMDESSDNGFITVVKKLTEDVFHVATLVKRLSVTKAEYFDELSEDANAQEMKEKIAEHVHSVIEKCQERRSTFDRFEYLWKDDRQLYMDQFLKYGRTFTEVELDQLAGEEPPLSPPKLEEFEAQIRHFEGIYKTVMQMLEGDMIFNSWFKIDARPLKQSISSVIRKWSFVLTDHLTKDVTSKLDDLSSFVTSTKKGLTTEIKPGDYHGLVNAMGLLHAVKSRSLNTDEMFEPIRKTINMLRTINIEIPDETHRLLADLPELWGDIKKLATSVKDAVTPLQAIEVDALQKRCSQFETKNFEFREEFLRSSPIRFEVGPIKAFDLLDNAHLKVSDMEKEAHDIEKSAELFELVIPQYKQLGDCRRDVGMLKTLWDVISLVTFMFDDWRKTLWTNIDTDAMDARCRELAKELRKMDGKIKAWDAFSGLDQMVKDMITSLRAVGELRSNAIRDRHWKQLTKTTGVAFTLSKDSKFQDLLSLQLHRYEDEVKGIVDRATKELGMEKSINELDKTWSTMEFTYEKHPNTGVFLLKSSEELIETLESNQVVLQTMMSSKYVDYFLEQIQKWQTILSNIDQVITIWLQVQQTWSHLENIFMGSEDIRAQLPQDSKRFERIDSDFKGLMIDAVKTPNAIQACGKTGLYEVFERLESELAICEKALAEYLETKRLAFPRFYFISSTDLLDILAKGNQPQAVTKHLSKLFDSLARLEFEAPGPNGELSKIATGMYSKEDEFVKFTTECACTGAVENWLTKLEETMKKTLHSLMGEGVQAYEEKPREQWIFDFPAQISLAGTQIWWTTEVNLAFTRLEEGNENALKDYWKKQIAQLTTLITLIQGELKKGDRQKIMTICTLDVHARDIVAKLVAEKADNAQCFSWQCQLRLRWDEKVSDCIANICDAHFHYNYEYLGNTPRLVITPLTDRCYITLTQSLHLIMGGAPAGPAGTGKTETVKDLGRALAMMVYVFNCSEQMDYKSIGNIYKGLSQSGAWGCFDEFNRISVEVLSVVATQVKSIQDALRARKKRFIFQGEEIGLRETVGIFITMNPGYAGRTELPENIKALFRPCSMVVPDMQLICEIMLMAEGFVEASVLARKFHKLYELNRELLSKQDHYDWGLRAIKSVLVVAGSLKRAEPTVPEENILMRALRDFNLPKIVTDDLTVFSGLINDLFPKIEILRKRDEKFEEQIRAATLDKRLQTEDNFTLKVVQLNELLAVRHCVFVIGPAGSGKSQIWQVLARTYNSTGKKCTHVDLNPKAVSTDELFGCINAATREWKDGLFSSIMRDMANLPGTDPKWIILDGDIDPTWIESLNTVMDDNKVLTLASNDRIALKPHMRLIFEISNLKYATPATVSRAGILFVNNTDLGWNPTVQSWLDNREDQAEKSNLSVLFERYVTPCLDVLHSTRFKKMTPIEDASCVQTLCNILESLLTPTNTPKGCDKEWFEIYFVFAAVWAFGGTMFQDQQVDYRVEFSKWWNGEFKAIKFPPNGTVFDFYVDQETKKFLPWSDRVPKFEFDSETPLQSVLVHTSETIRIRYLLDLFVDRGKPILLVGTAGNGKTVSVQDKLNSYGEDRMIVNINYNFYTTSASLQEVLEKPLEKKAGRNYGPPGTKKLIYFMDDLNMPEVDKYGTSSPHTLLRQFLDYKHWYDRNKLTLKEIQNCQFVACMNPTAGSFTIDSRLQRHFAVFAVSFPAVENVQAMYSAILNGHVKSFAPGVIKAVDKFVLASLALHRRVSTIFLPTAIKFHYIFNLRDLSNIYQGILFCNKDVVKDHSDLLRVWIHESQRVYGDKLLDETDQRQLREFTKDALKKNFEDVDVNTLWVEPLIYSHFAGSSGAGGDPKYQLVKDWASLKKILEDNLEQYNEVNAAMDLVLFEDAMSHICRINRILESPRGNALLVGVGGSGKQSLARLAAFISTFEVFQIVLRKGYNINDLKTDIANLFIKTGQKNQSVMFLLTDSQIPDESFLVLVHDLLSTGNIPGLFTDDDVNGIISAIRNEVKAAGLNDTKDICWDFFIKKVRRNLKVVLCFSPVGNTLRSRCRKFPTIVNCTMIDWFHEWPEEALTSVAKRFIQTCELVPEQFRDTVAKFMSFAHQTVNQMSKKYLENERRHNYTTPKSFLELINLYKQMLDRKFQSLTKDMDRLENGLTKLQGTAAQVDDLKAKLAHQEVELKTKNEEAERLIEKVKVDTENANKEKAIADEEERRVDAKTKEVQEKQRQCEEDLRAAEPALKAAQDSLNTLNKNNLTELKSFGSPTDEVKDVLAAVLVMLSPADKIAKDRSWKAAKNAMAKVDSFLESLITFDKQNIAPSILEALKPYLTKPEFNVENVRSKSVAAAGLCGWVINIVIFYKVYCDVEPKRLARDAATEELRQSQAKLALIQGKIAELDRNLANLQAEFDKATNDKLRCEQEAKKTQETIVLANRLVNGLASEKVRWAEAVGKFKEQGLTLAGDVLLAAVSVSYVGCFSKRYRQELVYEKWIPALKDGDMKMPVSEGVDPLPILTNDAEIAKWNNEGLPNDRVSLENAAMLTNCKRWPLIIDPQLQGVKWIKQREGSNLKVLRLGAKNYLDHLEKAISAGYPVLLEGINETLDPVLDPILGRNTIKKGKYIKIGDKEVEYDPNFRLIIQTRLANPHYPPEIQAQTTLINFTVTREGLEDQLLAEVVNAEKPELERTKAELTKQQNEFKITLTELENNLLSRLSAAQGNFLGDYELVDNLETTKRTASEIEVKVEEAKITEKKINETREQYRPVAARASLLYFLLNELNQIHPMYQYSLNAFKVVFHRAIRETEAAEDVRQRVDKLIESITYAVFVYTTRGLFEKDKLIFASQLTFQILVGRDDVNLEELDFLLRGPQIYNLTSPVEWLTSGAWGTVKALAQMETFKLLPNDIEGSSKRWKKYCDNESPENEKLPQEWKNKTPLQKLCILRALRSDRMTYAMRNYIREKMGDKYVDSTRLALARTFEEMTTATPIFFILSPGVDPVKEVEALGRKLEFTEDAGRFFNVSLGQGQEIIAENALERAHKNGGWVMLQNIHLVAKWLPVLEKKLEALTEGAHADFRVFLSAEPAGDPMYHVIPTSILQASIKVTNEPPTGMQANIHRALDNFSQETLDTSTKEVELRAILFSLCYFHAVVLERRKFGTQGWNRPYPFSTGDLTISVSVLFNYLDNFPKVPWTDLRYIFGEIMYGGHISDDWDRRLCATYLEVYMREELLEGQVELAPNFPAPPTSDYKDYHKYIDEVLPPETPSLYGLHPNAEIGVLTKTAEKMFTTIFELQPREASGGSSVSREDRVNASLDEILEKLPDSFIVSELLSRVEERTPYISVAIQECDRMAILTTEIRRSLKELKLGLTGVLTITDQMDLLMNALFMNQVPATWNRLAYASLNNLGAWYSDLLLRIKELEAWVAEFQLPNVVWIGGLFNPQSFLTAIMQTTARKNEWPLDKMILNVDVLKKNKEDLNSPPREGAYIHGLYMEGARWDSALGVINDSLLKELTPSMPVVFVKAITVDKKETKNVYECPMYRTRQRGPTYIWTFNLKTKDNPSKWVLAGVALLLEVEGR